MLHIVNGDSVADKLKQGVVPGDILVWREIYTEGPVFEDSAEPANLALRAQYLEAKLGIPQMEFIQSSASQHKLLSEFRNYDEVVLWFEHDLFDQTMLCYLLHWFSRQPHGNTKLSLLCIGSFPGIESFRGLGQLSVNQMKTLSGTWHPITRAETELGRTLWEAYTSPDPTRLCRLLQEDTSALPFVQEAFTFHLSRFPSVSNGLGVIEQTTLQLLNDGVDRPVELFRRVGDHAEWLGMGDLQFWGVLRKLSSSSNPLIRIENTAEIPRYSAPSTDFLDGRIGLTDTGRSVLQGSIDWCRLNGENGWLGGVNLDNRAQLWRWDSQCRALVPPI